MEVKTQREVGGRRVGKKGLWEDMRSKVWIRMNGNPCVDFFLPLSSPPAPACRALVDELEWEIAQVDPKKTIQMGSFRINPDGSQSVVEVTVTVSPNKVDHTDFE